MVALAAAGLVCVPREPTRRMIEDGWAEAHDENAAGTWHDMVFSYLATQAGQNPESDATFQRKVRDDRVS